MQFFQGGFFLQTCSILRYSHAVLQDLLLFYDRIEVFSTWEKSEETEYIYWAQWIITLAK